MSAGMTPEEIKAFWDKYNALKASAIVPRVPRNQELHTIITKPVQPLMTAAPKDYESFSPEDEKWLREELKVIL